MSALTRYRVMAVVVGTMLLVLVFVAMPLQYGFGHPGPADVISVVHGMLYIVYLLTVLDLARRQRLGLRQLAAMVCAGFLPFLAFFIERRITRQLSGVPERDGAMARPVSNETGSRPGAGSLQSGTPAAAPVVPARPEALAPDTGSGG
jgi:integral membrane protein